MSPRPLHSEPLPAGNLAVSSNLDELASLLESQHANALRVRADRSAADSLRGLPEPVYKIFWPITRDVDAPVGLFRMS